MIRRLAHVCFVSDQLEAMRAFYAGVMGLPEKIVFRNAGDEIFGYYFDAGDSTYIEIFDRKLKQKQWGGDLEEVTGGGRYNHFCLEVTGLEELRAGLEEKGVGVSPIRIGMDQSMQAWTKDPDGNPIELMEYTARSLQVRRGAGHVAR